jgi:hypothetical protein
MSAGLRRVLVWLSGARPEILRRLPPRESAAFEGVGAAVLTSSFVVAVSAVFALRYLAIPFWGAVPLSMVIASVNAALDRATVVALQRVRRRLRVTLFVISRLLLALCYGVVVSTPLVLKVFHTEISAKLASEGYGEHPGILRELVALDEVAAHDYAVDAARLILYLLFALVSTLPVLVQILRLYAPPSLYEQVAMRALSVPLDEDRVQALGQVLRTRHEVTVSEREYADGLAELLNSLGPPRDESDDGGGPTTPGEHRETET